MLDQTKTIATTSFFMGSFHTWIFIKYFYATVTEDYKISLEWILLFIMKLNLYRQKRLLPSILCIY